jgi:hypothetical protein
MAHADQSSGTPHVICMAHVDQYWHFWVVFCRPLFVFWSLCCLFFYDSASHYPFGNCTHLLYSVWWSSSLLWLTVIWTPHWQLSGFCHQTVQFLFESLGFKLWHFGWTL